MNAINQIALSDEMMRTLHNALQRAIGTGAIADTLPNAEELQGYEEGLEMMEEMIQRNA